MNPFDILPRNLPRPVESQGSREALAASDGADASASSAGVESFVTLLQGLSERSPGSGKGSPFDADPELLNDLSISPETGAAQSDIASAVFVLLQGILPSGSTPSAGTGADGPTQDQGAFGTTAQDNLQLPNDSLASSKALSGQKPLVSVQHQETHFRPVLETPDAALAEAVGSEDFVSSQLPSGSREGAKPQLPSDVHRPVVDLSQAKPSAEQIPEEQPTTVRGVAPKGVERDSEKAENLTAATASNSRIDANSLPPATLNRIAAAVASELKDIAKAADPHSAQSGSAGTISIKASESVLRVLKLQLHPAELGVVTVKMKLAGDGLEMELHTEREETAQLLRHDSEKLSSLLRSAGYKPETINIQVIDPGSQDRNSLQRGQADFEMHGQSSHQGGSHQGDRHRNRDSHSDLSNTEQPQVSYENGSSPSRHSGSVYL